MIFLFFFSVVLSATRPRPPLGHTEDRRESRNLTCLLAKSCSDVTTRTMLWICKILFFSFYSFLFALNLKRITNTLKRYQVSHRFLWHCSFHFRYVRNMTRSCLLCNSRLFRKERLFLVLRVFCVILVNPRPTLNRAICGVYLPNVVET